MSCAVLKLVVLSFITLRKNLGFSFPKLVLKYQNFSNSSPHFDGRKLWHLAGTVVSVVKPKEILI